MRTEEPPAVRLADYAPPAFQIPDVRLDARLDADRTEVRATYQVRRTGPADAPLRLDGQALELTRVAIDGRTLAASDYQLTDEALTIPNVPDTFTLEIDTVFSPRANTALSGIYLSGERIFSQCEAEGFRRITYFLDRPDVLSTYAVRIEGDKEAFPTLLSNGNRVGAGDLADGRHWAEWRDPFPKPSYLFALVAGRFDLLEDSFTTLSGRVIPLQIFVDPGDAPRAAYAMDSLKRSMRWDEERFGREYDLDLFMIVAVRDFNFGAMENKGLNIFNSSLLLADSETATDFDFEAIEAVVAHEYFHNWTGNRITCRDWFQLCLKEGLTVYRDQEFSADQRGAAVQRIKQVRRLRARQFVEDAGPLAHPVRPASYMKIDNFYTATVYEKGAEVIRMLRELIGADAFRAGMDLYFERCDGTAATVEQFLSCFADASGRSLDDFLGWYEQAGTPRLRVNAAYDAAAGALDVTLTQSTPPTPGQPEKRPLPTPVRFGLLGPDGAPRPVRLDGENEPGPDERALVLEASEGRWRIAGLDGPPVVSPLRGFSAPVNLEIEEPAEHRTRRALSDPDLFNRWEAGQAIQREALVVMAGAVHAGRAPEPPDAALDVLAAAAEDAGDPSFAALALTPPDEHEIAQAMDPVDPAAIIAARRTLMRRAGERLSAPLSTLQAGGGGEPFSPDAASAGRRALRNAALRLLSEVDGGAAAADRFARADNMTDAMAALAALDASGSPALDEALAGFYGRWRENPLVLDKWFAVQARSSRADALDRVRALLAHPDYDERTPNRARAVLGAFAFGNLAAFHAPDGAGYELFVDRVLAIDAKNPALAARLLGAFEIWPRLEAGRRARAQAALTRARDAEKVSRNVYEIAAKSLSVD
ncbi:MAG: aminopeptidase N [Caulobacterales bacterium]|nr:aminopeptidase N [Caulobacterales bacterium]